MTSIEKTTFRTRIMSPMRVSLSSSKCLKDLKQIKSDTKRFDFSDKENMIGIQNKTFRSRNVKSVKKLPIKTAGFSTQPVTKHEVEPQIDDSLGWKQSIVVQKQKLAKTLSPMEFYRTFVQPLKLKRRKNPEIQSISKILDELDKQAD